VSFSVSALTTAAVVVLVIVYLNRNLIKNQNRVEKVKKIKKM
jgi:hypothetical protein